MSYDVGFEINGERVVLAKSHDLTGGTYVIGGTREAWLNITYNYGGAFGELFGNNGIRQLYGLNAIEVRGRIAKALERKDTFSIEEQHCSCFKTYKALNGPRRPSGHDAWKCYWAITRTNIVAALNDLLKLAELSPDESIFNGD